MRERWKEPREGSEIEPETVYLQAVEALYMRDGVPIEEWTGELQYLARLSGKHGAEAKASLNRAIS